MKLFTLTQRPCRLVFRLLYRHISPWQLAGFFLANLLGLCIVLSGWQFFRDVMPVMTAGDSFMKPEYAVVSKRVSALGLLGRQRQGFSEAEQQDLAAQPFAASVAPFTPARYGVYAALESPTGMAMGTEMFFESLPDRYIDADLSRWHYEPGKGELPVILPRSYLNLYNFGYAQARGLPTLTEGMAGMARIRFTLSGTAGTMQLTGRVVAFSNRLNTILVPQQFMDESNRRLSPDTVAQPARLVVSLKRPADERFAQYLQAHNLEAEASAADGGRMAWLMRLTISLVMGVGLVICALAFYVLLLSILLLLQKHTERIRTLLLIGYSPAQVAWPFHLLCWVLHLTSAVLAVTGTVLLRRVWAASLSTLYPQWEPASLWPTLVVAVALVVLTSILYYRAVRRKVRL